MFRFLLLVIVVFALFVFMRLVLLRLKILEMKGPVTRGPEETSEHAAAAKSRAKTIDAPKPLEVKSYMFTHFDYRVGPQNPEDFYENFYVNVGEAGADSTRTYSMYVTTPKALSSALRMNQHDYKFGRHLLVVERYDMKVILRAVQDRINELGLMGEDIT